MDYVHQNRCVLFTCCEVSNFKDSLGEEVNATLFLDVKNHGGEWMNRIRPDGNRLARLEVIMVAYIYIYKYKYRYHYYKYKYKYTYKCMGIYIYIHIYRYVLVNIATEFQHFVIIGNLPYAS